MAAVPARFICFLLVFLFSSASSQEGKNAILFDNIFSLDVAAVSTEKVINYFFMAEKSGNNGKKKKAVVNGGSKPSFSHIPEQLNNEAGFVAFSSDYHAPRHHPPKNN
ncbi:hypothetical protein P3X46_031242 [Hevea brasiliensis]|uniref:Uncharacterized protein n=1 Tax=Hevea brasiliensis TaxID=3981 RepID=A0ABQ9KLD2_HEVBR|nr:hypothetical protein P3X46_031242 [Hevea brasiliensis]